MALAWVHPDQATPESGEWRARLLEGADLLVPSVWFLEVSNALLVLERRRKLNRTERKRALNLLMALPAEVDNAPPARALSELATLAQEEGLSVYDAAYLDVAIRNGLPLACRDQPLRAAAVKRGVTVSL